jgi:serine/threonine protein phosphatase PrpC
MICPACGAHNRDGARFCFKCANPLPSVRPADSDQQWLAESLAQGDALPLAVTGKTGPLSPPDAVPGQAREEDLMDDPTPPRFAGRYLIEEEDAAPGPVSVLDTEPWRHCWACGSTANEAGEAFCIDCGAALEQRRYRALLTPADTPSGAALVVEVTDPAALAVLPEIWDQAEDEDLQLTLLRDHGRTLAELPIDETATLTIASVLADLLVVLHAQNLSLGVLAPGDLEPPSGGTFRLRDVPAMRRFSDDERDEAVKHDLQALAGLLETLSGMPRTTQRLSEDEAGAVIAGQPGLSSMLRAMRTGKVSRLDELATQFAQILAEATSPIPLRPIVGAATDTGIVRDHNEDSVLTLTLGLENDGQPACWGVYVVSDGMGGHAAGEVASGLAVRGVAEVMLSEYLLRATQIDSGYNEAEAREMVQRAVLRANQAIIDEGHAQGNDMGATLTMALVVGDRVTVGNVGDSRTYLYRDGKLRRISKDHSLVMRLVDLGQIRDDEIYTHPQRNAVLRSLGDRGDIEVDLFNERLRSGDVLLLCSDGQWEMTRDPEMERILGDVADPQAICQKLVEAANQAGGEDNISIVLVRFE